MVRVGYDPTTDRPITRDHCFLCGVALTGQNRTDEHVFPRWLQKDFKLWHARLNLLNGTSIPYRQLKIPCCSDCNHGSLAALEQDVRLACRQGPHSFCSLDRSRIYQWLLKMFYGVMFQEVFLPLDRKDPDSGSILPREFFEEFWTCHSMLQSIAFETEWIPNPPWSIFLFECHRYEEIERNFDFYDSLVSMTVAVRIGAVGVIVCLQDNNYQELVYWDYFKEFQGFRLHPIQFTELVSQVFYKQSRQDRVPKYVTKLPHAGDPRMQVISLPLQGLSTKPVYDDWNQRDYARVLSQFTGLPLEEIFREPDEVWSWLYNPDGSLNVMSANELPYEVRGASQREFHTWSDSKWRK